MFSSFRHLLGWIISAFYSRQDLILENLALRGQLLALHAKRPRHRLSARQKMFWVLLQRLWSGWRAPLVLVTPYAQAPGGRTPMPAAFRYALAVSRPHRFRARCAARVIRDVPTLRKACANFEV